MIATGNRDKQSRAQCFSEGGEIQHLCYANMNSNSPKRQAIDRNTLIFLNGNFYDQKVLFHSCTLG